MQSALRCLFITTIMALSLSAKAGAYEPQSCPVTGGRAVDFTTSEGSQLGIDLSPDGKWIVFDMLGDIYILPATGGKARNLTSGWAWDARPVWSPDGARVAFISDRMGIDQVFVVNAADGAHMRQVTHEKRGKKTGERTIEGAIKSAEWMPDSVHILVGGRKFEVDVANRAQLPIGTEFESDIYFGSSNGLYYFKPKLSADAAFGGLGLDMKPSHAVWKLTGKQSVERMAGLDHKLKWGWEPPAISANGRYLVYRDRSPIQQAKQLDPGYSPAVNETVIDTIRVYDQSLKKDTVLVGPGISPGWRSNGANDTVGFSSNVRYAISPDSKALFHSYGGKIHRVEIESGRETVIPMEVAVRQCLKPIARHRFSIEHGDLRVKNLRSITRSQDGKQLVFSALRRIYVAGRPAERPRLLYKQDEGQFEPTYSPDGRWIAYVTWSDTTGGHVWQVAPDGTRPEKLTKKPGFYLSPTWSPDGKSLAFVGSNDLSIQRKGFDSQVYGGQIHVLSLLDKSIRKLPHEARLGSQLSFAGDGQRIYFTPYEEGETLKLLSVTLNGADKLDQHVDRFFTNRGLSSAIVHPSGSAFAAVKYGNLYLVACDGKSSNISDFSAADCKETRVTRAGGNDPQWRDGGRTLEWSIGNTHYSASLEDLLSAEDPDSVAIDRIHASGKLQEIEVELVVARPQSPGVIALRGARLITMRGDEVIEDGTVLIRNGRIEQLGGVAEVVVPPGAAVFDLKGKTIIPGLIDAHAHFTDYQRDLLAKNHWESLVSLAYGITTVKDPSNGGDHAFSYAELVESGEMVGPRIFGTPGLISERFGEINSLDDALSIVARSKRLGATFVKYHTGYDRWARNWLIEAAGQLEMNVAAHLPASQYTLGRLNLSTIYDGATSSEHGITDASDLFGDVKEFVIQSGVGVCFAPLAGHGGYPAKYWASIQEDVRMKRFYLGEARTSSEVGPNPLAAHELLPLRQHAEANAQFLTAIAAGGEQVMIGSHGDQDGVGMHLEMWAHVRGGMTPHQVLRAATLNGAWGLGVDADLGSLEIGKIADLLVLGKSPLEDIRNSLSVELVMKAGFLRRADSLAEIWPKSQDLPQWRLEGYKLIGDRSSGPVHVE